jgi:hypothetical protein
MFQELNFGALGTFSPLNILSAPTFLPLEGHPYWALQEQTVPHIKLSAVKKRRFLIVFIWIFVDYLNLQNRIGLCNEVP